MLVGADNGIDRSALALALACVVARSFGQPVALVDADLERGTLTGMVNAEDVAGLSECLAGQLDLALDDSGLPADLQVRYRVSPRQRAPILFAADGRLVVTMALWGFLTKNAKPGFAPTNARDDKLAAGWP